MNKSKCKHCEYKWEARVKEPKACPRCKRRFDYIKTLIQLRMNGLAATQQLNTKAGKTE